MTRLTFLGAVGTVTGSCYLLETDRLKIMIDCGMFQGKRELRMRNYRNPQVAPREVDFILLTHAHIDHSGLIPRLVKQGFKGKILATRATVDLARVMLPDSGHIQEIEAEWESRKARRRGERALPPLYTAQDATDSLNRFEPVSYGQMLQLNNQVRVRFLDAGHILGSAIIEVWIREGEGELKIVFSGDLGNSSTAILRDPTVVSEADYLLIESTYGDRLHEPVADQTARLKEIIIQTISRNGSVVIPSFAVGRTQELLYALNTLVEGKEITGVPVYIDSPLAVSATEIFRNNQDCYDEAALKLLQSGDDPFSFPGLTYIRTAEESRAINEQPGGKIIISASGMCDAGRIKHHLKHNLWRPESAVVFVGFQGEGTLGRRILDGEKRVKILGEMINVAAQIYSLQGFSAHADQAGILSWISGFTKKPCRVFVVHGEPDKSQTLASLISQQTGITTVIPRLGEEYLLKPGSLEMTGAPVAVAAVDNRKRLLLALIHLEKKLAELKEEVVLSDQITGGEELENLFLELEGKVAALDNILKSRNYNR